jgi:hypothetical protein
MIRNRWIVDELRRLENEKFHGKVTINFCGGDVPNIDIQQHKVKPKQREDQDNGEE